MSKNSKRLMMTLNNDEENLRIFRASEGISMKVSEKNMCLTIIPKVTKKSQSFPFSLENAVL